MYADLRERAVCAVLYYVNTYPETGKGDKDARDRRRHGDARIASAVLGSGRSQGQGSIPGPWSEGVGGMLGSFAAGDALAMGVPIPRAMMAA